MKKKKCAREASLACVRAQARRLLLKHKHLEPHASHCAVEQRRRERGDGTRVATLDAHELLRLYMKPVPA